MKTSLVSIGLPVYNGARYLGRAIESILAQTYGNFELIISDNASEDDTYGIAKEYELTDERIRVLRQERNIGAHHNYNFVFHAGTGPFFKWMAHDDLMLPRFLEACVDTLLKREDVVLAYPRVTVIDSREQAIGAKRSSYPLDVSSPAVRFDRYLSDANRSEPIFGVFRRDALSLTPLLGHYGGSDWVLLAEVVLQGRAFEVPESLFLNRDHSERFSRALANDPFQSAWFSPDSASPATPRLNQLSGYLSAMRRSRLGYVERSRVLLRLAKWAALRSNELLGEAVSATRARSVDLRAR